MRTLALRKELLELIDEAVGSGASHSETCKVISIAPSTLRQWRPAGGVIKADCRPAALRPLRSGLFSDKERECLVVTLQSP